MDRNYSEKVEELTGLMSQLKDLIEARARIRNELRIKRLIELKKQTVDVAARRIMDAARDGNAKLRQYAERQATIDGETQTALSKYNEAVEALHEKYDWQINNAGIMIDIYTEEKYQNYGDTAVLQARREEMLQSPEYIQHTKRVQAIEASIKKCQAKGKMEDVDRLYEELEEENSTFEQTGIPAKLTEIDEQIGQKRVERDQIKTKLSDYQQELAKLTKERDDAYNSLEFDKATALATIGKQNIFKRFGARIYNFFSGAKGKIDAILITVGKHTTDIISNIPEYKKTATDFVKDKYDDGKEKFYDTLDNILDGLTTRLSSSVQKLQQSAELTQEQEEGPKKTLRDRARSFKGKAQRGFTKFKTFVNEKYQEEFGLGGEGLDQEEIDETTEQLRILAEKMEEMRKGRKEGEEHSEPTVSDNPSATIVVEPTDKSKMPPEPPKTTDSEHTTPTDSEAPTNQKNDQSRDNDDDGRG